MKKIIKNFDNYIPKNKFLKYILLDYVITSASGKLPTSTELSNTYNININSVKQVCGELANSGYVVSHKKAGTKINEKFTREQVEVYLTAKSKIKEILKELDFMAFDSEEMFSCLVSAFSECQFSISNILYVENDFYELLIGKTELENELGVTITPMFINDVIQKVNNRQLHADLIITTFYCEQILRNLNISSKIIPLKITPPFDQLINFSQISRDTYITVVVISNVIKERIENTYVSLIEKFPYFKVVTINEALNNKDIINKTEILMTLKSILMENEKIFKNIPHIVSYNRFHDKEGFEMIKNFLMNFQEEK